LAALLGALMLGEHRRGLQWLAVTLIMFAAAGGSVTARRDPPKPEAADVIM